MAVFARTVMVIREASEADATAIAGIRALSWRSTYRGLLSDEYLTGQVDVDRERVWRQRFHELAPHVFRVFIAEDADGPIGFACVLLQGPSTGALLDNLHVVPEKQGGGVGRRLMAEVARWVVERDPGATLHLWVFEANAAARRFYLSLGATECATEEREAPDGRRLPGVRCQWDDPRVLCDSRFDQR